MGTSQAEAGSSSASTFVTPLDSQAKFDHEHTVQVDDARSLALPSQSRTPQTQSIWSRFAIHAQSQYPLAYARVRSAVLYVRGPRAKVDLPDPSPILNLHFRLRGQEMSYPIEAVLIRATRSFSTLWVVLLFGAAYVISLAFLARANYFLTPSDSLATCTSTYWLGNDGCGLDGQDCLVVDDASLDFRCPAQCNLVVLENPRTVGNEQVDSVPLIVGGGDANKTYRGDSFICSAAVQAGMFDDNRGGCASLALVTNFTGFLPISAHGLTSIGFPTTFPVGFQFSPNTALSHCSDLRNEGLAFNILVTAILFLVIRPRPIILFWSLVCIGFWHVTLFSQPRSFPPPLDQAFGTFLPALFVAYTFWRLAVRFVIPAFSKAPIERAIWFLPMFWVGVLVNVIFAKLPVDRLLASDIDGHKGAVATVVIVAVLIFGLVINQIRVIRKTGWLPFYLAWYLLGGLVALVLSQLPNLQLRFHHYIAAIVFLPGTAFPTRISAICQAFLLGMFLNGVAAFDFASILQTAADLQRDAPSGSTLPTFLTNSTTYNSSIPLSNQTIVWDALSDASEGWDGFALLVDDVERYTGAALNYSLSALQEGIPHFFRLAFQSDGTSGDFTMPATLWPNGTWVDPLPGPS